MMKSKVFKTMLVLTLSLLLISMYGFVFAKGSLDNSEYLININVNVSKDDGSAASNAKVILYSTTEERFVDVKYTDEKGRVTFEYVPKFKSEDLQKDIVGTNISIMVFTNDGEVAFYDFTKNFVIKKEKFTAEKINSIEGEKDKIISIKTKKIEVTEQQKIEAKNKLKNLLLTKQINDLSVEILNPILLEKRTHYNVPTIVGEIHTTQGITSQFSFAVNAGFDIGVGYKYISGNAEINGHYNVVSGWNVTWPQLTTSPGGSGYGRKCVSSFNYNEEHWLDPNTGLEWSKVYAVQYNGGAQWGEMVIGYDDKVPPVGSKGDYPANNPPAIRNNSNGYQYGIAATIPTFFGSLDIDLITHYNNYQTSTFWFGSQHSLYHLYDNYTGWQQIYCSYE